jgi:hypothetical protein
MEANMEKPAHWAEGLALASAALWPLLLGSMLSRGLITRDEFREIIDGALLSLENLEVDTPLAAIRAARASLEELSDLPEIPPRSSS